MKIAVVIPCYRVRAKISSVIAGLGPEISQIYCVDDGCPEGTGDHVARAHGQDPRVVLLRHETNRGVGAAMVTGYRAALDGGCDIVVKIDGDGQMDPSLIPALIRPIEEGMADYVKGNRFYRPESLAGMPAIRVLGNLFLSFMTKFSSGYWRVFDPTNGFTAIHASVLRLLPLEKINPGYFYESEMLFRLNIVRALVTDMPMDAVYEDEASNLRIWRVMVPFLAGHLRLAFKRIIYRYFLHDFSIASLQIVLGLALFMFGTLFGLTNWLESMDKGVNASAGTVMLAALPVIVGVQMILSAINFDMASEPTQCLHIRLSGRAQAGFSAGNKKADARPA